MSYTLSQKTYSNLKRRLTTHENRLKKAISANRGVGGPPPKELSEAVVKAAGGVIKECHHAKAIFDEQGYPDSHSRWDRAEEDASNAYERARRGATA